MTCQVLFSLKHNNDKNISKCCLLPLLLVLYERTLVSHYSYSQIFKVLAVSKLILTLVLLNLDMPCFGNSVEPEQLASEEAN